MNRPGQTDGAASRVLSLLADPLNVRVLTALEDGPIPLADLRRAVGLPSQTTLRTRIRALVEVGVLIREKKSGFAATVTYELTRSGRELREVIEVLATWLAACPGGALSIGSRDAKLAVKALIGGWSTNMLRALAVRPLSLTDLDRVITNVNYPSLERRLDAMRLLGLVTATPPNGGRPFGVTEWLRQSAAPLLAAAKLERHLSDSPDLSRLNIETIFLLAIPLLRLPGAPDGLCHIRVQLEDADTLAEITIAVHGGQAKSSRATTRNQAPNWLSGTVPAWFDALDRKASSALRSGGDQKLAEALVTGLGDLVGAHPAVPDGSARRVRLT